MTPTQPQTTATGTSIKQTTNSPTPEQNCDAEIIRSHKRALRLFFKPKIKSTNCGTTPQQNESSSSSPSPHRNSVHKLKSLKKRKIALQAELAELLFAEKETIFYQVQSLAQTAASLHPATCTPNQLQQNSNTGAFTSIHHRPYLHTYDQGEARLVMSYTQEQRRTAANPLHAQVFQQQQRLPESIQNERKKRKLMGAHRLTGISVFNILREEHHWYLGARIDITKNGGAFQLSNCDDDDNLNSSSVLPTVYYVFVELVDVQGVRRWKLKNHTFPHCLASYVSATARDYYMHNSRSRYNRECNDPIHDLHCILNEIHGIVHAYHVRADSVDQVRRLQQQQQPNVESQGEKIVTFENISWNDAFTLVSFQLVIEAPMEISNEEEGEAVMELKVKLRYAEVENALPTNVSLDLSRIYKIAGQGEETIPCNRRNPQLRELFADCAENLRTVPLGEAVDAMRELFLKKYRRLKNTTVGRME